MASASSTKMCRGTAFIAASTTSSRMPCSRSRSTIRARVRAEVMPMPDIPSSSPSVPIARASVGPVSVSAPSHARDARHLVAIGEIDLQRRHRRVARLDRVEIGAFAGVRRGAGRADPVDGLAARALRADHVLRLVPPPEPRHAVPLAARRAARRAR